MSFPRVKFLHARQSTTTQPSWPGFGTGKQAQSQSSKGPGLFANLSAFEDEKETRAPG